jgi:hypothetical protein
MKLSLAVGCLREDSFELEFGCPVSENRKCRMQKYWKCVNKKIVSDHSISLKLMALLSRLDLSSDRNLLSIFI